MDIILGIDPGVSGGAALISKDSKFTQVIAFSKLTPTDVTLWVEEHKEISMCYIEAVNSMPGQGVASTFKFGMNYGMWQGILLGLKIPFQRVYPLRWQRALSCQTRGNKNITKAKAQELFPSIKITHAIADALLIAEYGRRQELMCSVNDL